MPIGRSRKATSEDTPIGGCFVHHGDAAAQWLIARVGPPIPHWGMSRPLAPLSQGSGVSPFCVGSVARRCRGAVCE
jgi:hypothetical protein